MSETHLPSVCSECKTKFGQAKEQTKTTDEDDEDTCKETLKRRKQLYAKIREERKNCEECEQLEVNFGFKIIEYLWRRETRKSGIDPFERILSAIRHVFERQKENPTVY
jgi:hypothetical protein